MLLNSLWWSSLWFKFGNHSHPFSHQPWFVCSQSSVQVCVIRGGEEVVYKQTVKCLKIQGWFYHCLFFSCVCLVWRISCLNLPRIFYSPKSTFGFWQKTSWQNLGSTVVYIVVLHFHNFLQIFFGRFSKLTKSCTIYPRSTRSERLQVQIELTKSHTPYLRLSFRGNVTDPQLQIAHKVIHHIWDRASRGLTDPQLQIAHNVTHAPYPWSSLGGGNWSVTPESNSW